MGLIILRITRTVILFSKGKAENEGEFWKVFSSPEEILGRLRVGRPLREFSAAARHSKKGRGRLGFGTIEKSIYVVV
jgi:hypothetical protein